MKSSKNVSIKLFYLLSISICHEHKAFVKNLGLNGAKGITRNENISFLLLAARLFNGFQTFLPFTSRQTELNESEKNLSISIQFIFSN